MFTHDWFSRNIPNWSRWLSKFAGVPNLRFIEIGCFEGKATIWLLEHILTDPTSMISVVDTFQGSFEHSNRGLDLSDMYENFKQNIEPYRNKVDVCRGMSQLILREFTPNSYDFIYIDGSHQASDVLEDAVLAWRLLKSGGIMLFDDYLWGSKFPDERMKPKIAIDAFLRIFRGKYDMIEMNRQVCIKKI